MPSIETNPSLRPATAERVLLGVLAAMAVALLLAGPIAQWSDYHQFADRRAWLGLPNAADVLSNLPFALVGAWGLWRAAPHAAWRMFCLALIATALGSSYYHWHPTDARLVCDRIPIAWACLALVAALLVEHGQPRWADGRRLVALALAGGAAVVAWYASGDLRLYVAMQLLPILLVPLLLLLRLPRERTAAPALAWWSVLACYGVAKAAEGLDHEVLHALGVVSGHTLKHLFAALGAALLLWGVSSGSRR